METSNTKWTELFTSTYTEPFIEACFTLMKGAWGYLKDFNVDVFSFD